ncbi:RNA polymerase sigma factor [Alloalcanivorax gelatiniphagus]|uniref:Sigma-70 family RNA polymerase sigma factor n=1 Tax=Alloalcanivorax gelatiniphagus TaxID=1194167 RepID=A0ABY2XN12_9GAMM|nr:sigma-70 family RNA polymerase sigma factor [Alloalcanivorax gelatiniphagus]TMW12837.1 sigma-70 family RNA polymerase sigma factor [Alloalcanivorax gelatiniphagus]|tara:strand:+ start:27207 stop:27716 length:510 start_codon:yes stop_codon:yes gene_type:complete
MSSQSPTPALYAEYTRKIHRYLWLRTGDTELAADLTQECFTRLLAHDGEVPIERPLPYLYTLAGRLLTDHRRRHETWRTGTLPPADLDGLLDDRAGPATLYETHRQVDDIEAALRRLPARSRNVFQLCRVEGHTYREAARELRLSVSAVQKHLTLAMRYILDQTHTDDD